MCCCAAGGSEALRRRRAPLIEQLVRALVYGL
jgi:hypothetical protein